MVLPALAGFGRDLRAVEAAPTDEFSLEDSVKALRQENVDLKAKVEEILSLLKTKSVAAGGGT